MEMGIFTGKNLSNYVSDTAQDYFNARQIINGHDQAETIAGFATRFKAILESTKC
jgi:trehalose-6-phosphate synthase